jgi:hypothetical protein
VIVCDNIAIIAYDYAAPARLLVRHNPRTTEELKKRIIVSKKISKWIFVFRRNSSAFDLCFYMDNRRVAEVAAAVKSGIPVGASLSKNPA